MTPPRRDRCVSGAAGPPAVFRRLPALASSALAGLVTVVVTALAVPSPAAAERLIVRYRSDGEHAVTACAQGLHERNARFAAATADASPSLDALHARHRVERIRALFRASDGRALGAHRSALRERLAAAASKHRPARRGPVDPADVPDLAHVYVVEVASDAVIEEVVDDFRGDPHVAWAQADHAHVLDGVSSRDPFLDTAGSWQQPYADMWGLHRIRAEQAWSVTRGAGVVVAVVDTGLDTAHPDIAANVWVNPGEDLDGNGRVDPGDWNGIDDDGNGFIDDLQGFDFANSVDADGDGRYDGADDVSDADPFDDSGHGTHVAGTIAAVANNGIGIAGVAPDAKVMALKGFRAEGPSPDSLLWRAVLYAIENGADVVNNSWSCSPACPVNPLADEMTRLARRAGVVIVTSAGNRQTDVIENAPENGTDVITVAATGEDDDLSRSITNFGWMIDVGAPGGGPAVVPGVRVARRNILSLRSSAVADDDPFIVGADYLRWAGTSMAAPHVSGVVALLRAAHPGLSFREVRRVLRQSAVDLGAPGPDREFGAGRLDAWAAVTHPPLPDLEADLTSPAQRSIFGRGQPFQRFGESDPFPEAVEIVGTAAGTDLVDWELSVGRGNVPEVWHVIGDGRAGPVRDGVLGHWRIDEFDQGTYVLRLRVTATDGSVYSEYRLASIERSRPRALSAEGPDAQAPDLDGDYVVWQSARRPDAPESRSDSTNVFVSRISTGEEWALAATAREEHSPTISSRVVAWLVEDREAGTSRVEGCVLDRRGDACRPFSTPSGDAVFVAPASAAGRVFWVDAGAAGPDLRGCRPDPRTGTCVEYDLGLEPGVRGFPGSDGRTLSWLEGGGAPRHGSCRIDRKSGACEARYPEQPIRAISRPTASRDLVAWVGFSLSGRNPLVVCERDDESGACPEILVDQFVQDTTPRLSRDRLVWERRVGDEAADVFYCEVDLVRGRCPLQRITAELSVQSEADVDGRRVVWADRRDGGARVYMRRLPASSPQKGRVLRVGEPLNVPVWASEGEGGDIRLSVEVAGEGDAEALGIRLRERPAWPGVARGVLSWRPRADQVGTHVVTVTGTTATGLATRESFRIIVEPAALRRPVGRSRGFEHVLAMLARWLGRS